MSKPKNEQTGLTINGLQNINLIKVLKIVTSSKKDTKLQKSQIIQKALK